MPRGGRLARQRLRGGEAGGGGAAGRAMEEADRARVGLLE